MMRTLKAANLVSCNGMLLRLRSVEAVGSGALLRSALVRPAGVVSCCVRWGAEFCSVDMVITPG